MDDTVRPKNVPEQRKPPQGGSGTAPVQIGAHEGSKYLRLIYPADGIGEPIRVDVYAVLAAFEVTCPARQHAAKKILCAGLRGKGDELADLVGALAAVSRAVEMQRQKHAAPDVPAGSTSDP